MSIIVGFVPTPAGEAALDRRHRRGHASATRTCCIVNSAREGVPVDKSVAPDGRPGARPAKPRQLRPASTATVIQPPYQHDLADEFLDVARDVERVPDRHRPAAPVPRWASSSWAATPSASSCRRTVPFWP